MEKIDEFKKFVKDHPLLKFEVRDKTRTWQNIYEEWSLLGEGDSSWDKYSEKPKNTFNSVEGQETLRNVMNYVKKINPDTVSKTLNNVGKVAGILQGFLGGSIGAAAVGKATGDPLFDRKFDDWY